MIEILTSAEAALPHVLKQSGLVAQFTSSDAFVVGPHRGKPSL
jgi:hypothetical protein